MIHGGRLYVHVYKVRFHLSNVLKALQEPACNSCNLVNFFYAPSSPECFQEGAQTAVSCNSKPIHKYTIWELFVCSFSHAFSLGFIRSCQRTGVRTSLFQGCPCLEERFLEISTNCHDFTGRFHRGSKGSVSGSEFIEWPSGYLDNNIVKGRFECCCSSFSSNRIW